MPDSPGPMLVQHGFVTCSLAVDDQGSQDDHQHTFLLREEQMNDPYAEVRAHFDQVDAVEVSAGRGAQGIKLGGKMFVMFHKGQLLVKLDPKRVAEVIASGEGLAYDPGTGKLPRLLNV